MILLLIVGFIVLLIVSQKIHKSGNLNLKLGLIVFIDIILIIFGGIFGIVLVLIFSYRPYRLIKQIIANNKKGV